MDGILKKRWDSLSSLKEYLEKNKPDIQILYFNGWMLQTSEGTFYLSIDGVTKKTDA